MRSLFSFAGFSERIFFFFFSTFLFDDDGRGWKESGSTSFCHLMWYLKIIYETRENECVYREGEG